MNKDKEPIFKEIFSDDWDKLPIVMKKHYANRPFSDDVNICQGVMDIEFNWLGKLCTPLFKLFGTLIPYQGKGIKAVVKCGSSKIDNSFSFDRSLYFPNKKPFYFRSKMVPLRNNELIEFMKFGIGWHMKYEYEDNLVKLKHIGYVINIFGLRMPIPLALLLGKGYAQEKALSDDEFEMFVTIIHPLWGKIYEYRGQFKII